MLEIARELSAALASSQRNIEEFLAKTREVVTATCVGVGQTKMRIDAASFDWVIVDEAARCTPGELAVPIQMGRRVLLVGDHLQLEPMVEAEVLDGLKADMPGTDPREFRRSDFERARLSSFGATNAQVLTEQYRMDEEICELVSETFYVPHKVRLVTSMDREANPLFAGQLAFPLDRCVTWIDTSKSPNRNERAPARGKHSFWNEAEVDATLRLLERIASNTTLVAGLASGKEETPIGVICMYMAQKEQIEQEFARRPWSSSFRRLVRIETVDSYQGKENAIVILSAVRNNRSFDAGHVASPNRCNVAMSRAKERLYVVGARSMWQAVPAKQPMRRVAEWCNGSRLRAGIIEAGLL